MESFYRFCRDRLQDYDDVSTFECFRKQLLYKSIIAILGAIEIKLRPIVKKANERLRLTSITCLWLEDTTQIIQKVLAYVKEPPEHRSILQSVLTWCSSTEFTEEMIQERRARKDASIDKMLDEALCRAFVILDRLYWTRNGTQFEIKESMDLKQAKFDFLGCSCDLRHQVRTLSIDIPRLREAASEIYEERMCWFQREMQFQKQCASVSYEWQLFTLKHELDSVIVEKDDIIEDQQAQISELSTQLKQTINRSILPQPNVSFARAH